MVKFLAGTKNKVIMGKNAENIPSLEFTEIVLDNCNIVKNDYRQDSRVLYAFIPNESFCQLLDIFPKRFIFSKTFNSELWYNEVWFADQNYKPVELEATKNITFVIG